VQKRVLREMFDPDTCGTLIARVLEEMALPAVADQAAG